MAMMPSTTMKTTKNTRLRGSRVFPTQIRSPMMRPLFKHVKAQGRGIIDRIAPDLLDGELEPVSQVLSRDIAHEEHMVLIWLIPSDNHGLEYLLGPLSRVDPLNFGV